MKLRRYVFAITGASGSIIAVRTIKELLEISEIYLVISKQAFPIIKHETGIDWSGKTEKEIETKIRKYFNSKGIFYFAENNLFAPMSSGSFKTNGMLVVPCTMKTLSGIANGYSDSLIERAADATIKEGRLLALAPRETPFSAIHLENMLRLARLGVKIIPPVMGFYNMPENLNDMIDFAAGKILDSSGIDNELFKRWKD